MLPGQSCDQWRISSAVLKDSSVRWKKQVSAWLVDKYSAAAKILLQNFGKHSLWQSECRQSIYNVHGHFCLEHTAKIGIKKKKVYVKKLRMHL